MVTFDGIRRSHDTVVRLTCGCVIVVEPRLEIARCKRHGGL